LGGQAMIDIDEEPEARLLEFVRSWFALMAHGQFEQALAAIDEPNSYGVRWTKDGLIDLLRDVFRPGSRFEAQYGAPMFSDPDRAAGTAHHSFGRIDAGGFWLDHEVPLNGVYSDLTAQFEFLPRQGGFAVVLHDLHVM
jgi:hypothetical protein